MKFAGKKGHLKLKKEIVALALHVVPWQLATVQALSFLYHNVF